MVAYSRSTVSSYYFFVSTLCPPADAATTTTTTTANRWINSLKLHIVQQLLNDHLEAGRPHRSSISQASILVSFFLSSSIPSSLVLLAFPSPTPPPAGAKHVSTPVIAYELRGGTL